ncbi:coiled-coil domain-containing protein [Mycobacterium sp. 4D054]|uniref:coiled-coil domain-containing protein n=1 Tax=Mycobacterium sp. 4D054 TaxID=3457440 RepID=UPI003FCEE814
MTAARLWVRRTAYGAAATVLALAVSIGAVAADPASDALSRLNELSRQAVQSREAVTAAQHDADAKQADQTAAEERHRGDLEALDAANAKLAPYQAAVNRVAAMTYMGGRTGQVSAVLGASSPQQLIDELAVERAVAAEMAAQMTAFKTARERAAAAAQASDRSAAEARAAAEQSAAVRADLETKWADLQRQILAAEAQYAALTPRQQAVIDNAAAVLPPAPNAPGPADPPLAAIPGVPPGDVAPPPAAVPDLPEALPVGVASEAGLQPNTILAARAVSARFPQIADIDGVRPDSKPWHPSGLAIDIMIPNHDSPEGIALGNEILAFMMANAARFGLQDVIWRGTYYTPGGPRGSGYGHYDHVHVTTTPRR